MTPTPSDLTWAARLLLAADEISGDPCSHVCAGCLRCLDTCCTCDEGPPDDHASEVTASDQQAGTWTPLPPPFSKYEVSFDGFGPDRRPVRRIGAGGRAGHAPSNHGGYLMVKPYDDSGKQQTVSAHSLVLLGATGVPCPPGLESPPPRRRPAEQPVAPGRH